MTYFYFPYLPEDKESQKDCGTYPGYYLVRESDSKRFFISKVVDLLALEQTASEALSDASGWGYWIDRSLGKDVNGSPAWVNVDQSARFI